MKEEASKGGLLLQRIDRSQQGSNREPTGSQQEPTGASRVLYKDLIKVLIKVLNKELQNLQNRTLLTLKKDHNSLQNSTLLILKLARPMVLVLARENVVRVFFFWCWFVFCDFW